VGPKDAHFLFPLEKCGKGRRKLKKISGLELMAPT